MHLDEIALVLVEIIEVHNQQSSRVQRGARDRWRGLTGPIICVRTEGTRKKGQVPLTLAPDPGKVTLAPREVSGAQILRIGSCASSSIVRTTLTFVQSCEKMKERDRLCVRIALLDLPLAVNVLLGGPVETAATTTRLGLQRVKTGTSDRSGTAEASNVG